MEDERTYSKSEIRERRREAEQWLPLQQRQLAALAKLDEAYDELDQVEREMAALARGGTQPEQPAETAPSDPRMTGERALRILEDRAGSRLAPKDVVDDWMKRGWSVDTSEERKRVLAVLRHSLRRLARNNEHVERDETGTTFYYWYVSGDSHAQAPANVGALPARSLSLSGVAGNGMAHQGGRADG
jgi:hypothetical protein